jgi:hypothetical protein
MIKLLKTRYYSFTRYIVSTFEENALGRLFVAKETIVDMSDVEIVHSGVDTVRQVFHGSINSDMYDQLEELVKTKDSLFDLGGVGTFWHVSRLSRSSFYRLKIQNNELGVTILFGHYNSSLDHPASHLKIELSPHFIEDFKVDGVMNFFTGNSYGGSGIVGLFLNDFEYNGVAVHLAVDYQGALLPDNFTELFTTRMRTFRTFEGVSEIDLSGFSESVASYGRHSGQLNYLIGKAGHTQICLYDKTIEATKNDKLDYWQACWKRFTPFYDDSKVVRRLELRFHQSVLRELGASLDLKFDSFKDIEPYLTDIFRYGLQNNRLDSGKSTKVPYEVVNEDTGELSTKYKLLPIVHPLWQIFLEEIEIFVPPANVTLKRKKKESVDPVRHNVTALYGNFVSLCARDGISFKLAFKSLKRLPIYHLMSSYYRSMGIDESALRQKLEKDISLRRIIGKAA